MEMGFVWGEWLAVIYGERKPWITAGTGIDSSALEDDDDEFDC